MSSYQLMFPGVRSYLVFSGFEFKPPASSFQSYSCSRLKTSPSIQHHDKTSMLIEKRFSTQKGSLNYMEKREGQGR